MKAAVHRRFGPPDVVTVDDVPKPVPRDDEVLVQIHAATVGASVLTPVIDACYPLRRIADAHRHVDEGRKKGNVVVTMTDSPERPSAEL